MKVCLGQSFHIFGWAKVVGEMIGVLVGAWFSIGFFPPPPPQEVNSCPELENHYRPYMCYIFGKPWVQGTLWQCYGVSDMQIHKDKDKDKDKYTWARK